MAQLQPRNKQVPDKKMHAHEIDINTTLLQQLLNEQFSYWANLPITPIQSAGTDNIIYRLGTEMCVRLPRIIEATKQVEKEQKWLPKFTAFLPLAIPTLLAKGSPNKDYPWYWSIYSWLEGENIVDEKVAKKISDSKQAASDLAQFLVSLQKIDSSGAPYSHRGGELQMQDVATRSAIEFLRDSTDSKKALKIWEESLQAPKWNKPPVWLHGDLLPTNLLANNGKLSAVIDFGLCGIGDPACDLIAAWSFFSASARKVFREKTAVDEATWMRARGWALSIALIIIPYYQNSNPTLTKIARRIIDEIFLECCDC